MPHVPPTVPLSLPLTWPRGGTTTLGEHLTTDLTVVQLVRYFGCLPCQEWLLELDRESPRLGSMGIGAIVIGGSADYQASWLREEKGVRLPLFLDPEHRFRDVVGAARPLGWRLADPRGAAAYARSLGRGLRPKAITKDTVRSPAVVVLDRAGRVTWSYVGARIGDYPGLQEVVDAVGSPA